MTIKKLSKMKSEKGMVSILVTMFIMIIISLVVIGFARLTIREQRQSLDDQLSTQAFYAAETGINDSVKKLVAASGSGQPFTASYNSDCNSFMSADLPNGTSYALQNQLDGSNVEYTCVFVNPALSRLEYPDISKDFSKTIYMKASSGSFSTLNISWESKDVKDGTVASKSVVGCPAAGTFPASSAWLNCTAGVLRIDLVDVNGGLSRSGLLSGNKTFFLVPVSGGGAVTVSYGATSGEVVSGNCSTGSDPMCTVTITGLGSPEYVMRARSIYASNYMEVTATNSSGPVDIVGAQVEVDSTGRATDILRRVSARVDISGLGDRAPDFAIESRDSICKRFTVIPGLAPTDAGGNCSLLP